ncbi:oxaloacetate decarboxylase [Clostridia bacterium]|nr:oxaloacetate decarboxylase [Clostridia bacterium]
MEKKVLFTDTTFRDGQQSLIATRLKFADIEPVLDEIDGAGLYSMEVWGGATFDTCLRYLREDPWERLRSFKKHLKKTKLQMLFRGQNMLGYHTYPDDVVDEFLKLAIKNGIDIVRIFDALNDIRNLESSVKSVKKYGGHAQLAISYTTSDVHTTEYYKNLVKDFVKLGADSIAIKDMAGLLLPSDAYNLVSEIKKITDLPLQIHSHYTSGLASCTYLEAVRAGADIIDTSLAPLAMGSGQPATEVMSAILAGYVKTDIDNDILSSVSSKLSHVRTDALKSGLLDPIVLNVNIDILKYQVPGGMLSNLVSQLKLQNAEDKYEEVLREIPKVRADFGYPPLVTPSSQIVGTQAVMNVVSGERYKLVPKETKEFVRGMYGKTPVPISDEIVKKILGSDKPITQKPSELLKPLLGTMDKELKEQGSYKESEEDLLSYILFPPIALDYFKYRHAQKYKLDPNLYDKKENVYPV